MNLVPLSLYISLGILLEAIYAIRQNLAYCRETSHDPESPSGEGQNLIRTTTSMLAMTILNDQICHVMFTLKNNGVLPFERNRSIPNDIATFKEMVGSLKSLLDCGRP